MDFLTNCERGDLEKVIELCNVSDADFNKGFIVSCEYGRIELAKWFHSFGKQLDIGKAFKKSCYSDQIETAIWLYSLGELKQTTKDAAFTGSSYCKSIDVVKWLYSVCEFSPETKNTAFTRCCTSGSVELATWLYSVAEYPESVKLDAVTISCNNGHLELIKWLHQVGFPIGQEEFAESCLSGNLDLVQFIYSLGMNITYNNNKALDNACYYLCTDIAKWLYASGAKFSFGLFDSFSEACRKGNLPLVKWLHDLGVGSDDPSEFLSDAAILCNIFESSPDVLRWLLKTDRIIFDINREFIEFCSFDQIEHAKICLDFGVNLECSGTKAFLASYKNRAFRVCEWLLTVDPTLIQKNIKKLDSTIEYEKIGIRGQNAVLFECIRTNKVFPEIEDIDDCIIYSLAYHNTIKHLNKLSQQFSFIKFEIKHSRIRNLITNWSNIKSARST